MPSSFDPPKSHGHVPCPAARGRHLIRMEPAGKDDPRPAMDKAAAMTVFSILDNGFIGSAGGLLGMGEERGWGMAGVQSFGCWFHGQAWWRGWGWGRDAWRGAWRPGVRRWCDSRRAREACSRGALIFNEKLKPQGSRVALLAAAGDDQGGREQQGRARRSASSCTHEVLLPRRPPGLRSSAPWR